MSVVVILLPIAAVFSVLVILIIISSALISLVIVVVVIPWSVGLSVSWFSASVVLLFHGHFHHALELLEHLLHHALNQLHRLLRHHVWLVHVLLIHKVLSTLPRSPHHHLLLLFFVSQKSYEAFSLFFGLEHVDVDVIGVLDNFLEWFMGAAVGDGICG